MAATPVEIIATVFVLASFAKILVLLTNKDSWLKATEKLYKNPYLTRTFFGILALIVLLFLLRQLSIIEIIAVMAFTSILVAYELMEYPEEALRIAKKAMKNRMSNSQLVLIIFWLILMILAFLEIFF